MFWAVFCLLELTTAAKVFDPTKASMLDPARDIGTVADLQRSSTLQQTLLTCWLKPTGLFAFDDETCHIAWKYTLRHDTITAFVDIENLPLPGAEHQPDLSGDVHFLLKSGYSGVFRSCAFGPHSYVNDLAAYELDRLLHLHRTPATALRQLVWQDDIVALSPKKTITLALTEVRDRCHQSRSVLSGVVIGWSKHELRPVSTIALSRWLDEESFNAQKPTQRLIEFVRLAIALIMFDSPEKLIRGQTEMFVPQEVNGKPSPYVGTYFYVYTDNGRASFADELAVENPATPVCDRAKGKMGHFRCRVDPNLWKSSKTPKPVLRGILLSFLGSACLFPKPVAERLLHYGSLDPNQVISLTHELKQVLLMDDGLPADLMPSFHGLNSRLRAIFSRLITCVGRYKPEHVLIPDDIGEYVDPPPRVHYDPAGNRYVYKDKTGRWARDATYDTTNNARKSLLSLAISELEHRKTLGLLRPSDKEITKASARLAHTVLPILERSHDEYRKQFQRADNLLLGPAHNFEEMPEATSDKDTDSVAIADYKALFN